MLNPNVTLGELGIDSLMTVEVRQLLERDYDVVLSMQEIRELSVCQLKGINEACSDGESKPESSNVVEGKHGGSYHASVPQSSPRPLRKPLVVVVKSAC
ncbi:hypothetical protein MTO96_045053 [Rhipicephalus appendiculatus]